jgi:hypothetical protein
MAGIRLIPDGLPGDAPGAQTPGTVAELNRRLGHDAKDPESPAVGIKNYWRAGTMIVVWLSGALGLLLLNERHPLRASSNSVASDVKRMGRILRLVRIGRHRGHAGKFQLKRLHGGNIAVTQMCCWPHSPAAGNQPGLTVSRAPATGCRPRTLAIG